MILRSFPLLSLRGAKRRGNLVEARLKVSILCVHKMQNTASASPLPKKSFALQNLFRDFFILFLAKGARTPPSTPRPAHSAGAGCGRACGYSTVGRMTVLHLKHRNYTVRFRGCPSKVSPSWNDKRGYVATPSWNDKMEKE